MQAKQTSVPEVRNLTTGLAMGESPRWHEGRLWLSDWGAQEILAIDLDGRSKVEVRVPFGLRLASTGCRTDVCWSFRGVRGFYSGGNVMGLW